MRPGMFFFLLVAVLSFQLCAQIPQKKALLIQAGGGLGFHHSVIEDVEQRFADYNVCKLILTNSSNTQTDSIELKYKKYLGYNAFVQFDYFIRTNISAGLIGQYYSFSQTADLPPSIKKMKSYKLLEFNQLGPQLTCWKYYKNMLFNVSVNPNYSFGRLTRIPVIFATRSDFKTPEQEVL